MDSTSYRSCLVLPRLLSALCILFVLCGSMALAQNYKVDWSVVDIGGGAMSSTSYRTDASVGQTAVGRMASSSYQTFIGFWQIDTSASGVKEESHWSETEPLVTKLYAPFPNPCPIRSSPVVRYSLATETNVSIQLFDLTGRNLRTLCNARQQPGRYSIGPLGLGLGRSRLGSGVYFLKMTASDYKASTKLILF